MPTIELSDDEVFTIQAAVENLRSADRDDRKVEAAWRIASKLETVAKRAYAVTKGPPPTTYCPRASWCAPVVDDAAPAVTNGDRDNG